MNVDLHYPHYLKGSFDEQLILQQRYHQNKQLCMGEADITFKVDMHQKAI